MTPALPASVESELFRCESFRCTMLRVRCVQRQQIAETESTIRDRLRGSGMYPTDTFIRLHLCHECAQGREIAKSISGMQVEESKPKEVKPPKGKIMLGAWPGRNKAKPKEKRSKPVRTYKAEALEAGYKVEAVFLYQLYRRTGDVGEMSRILKTAKKSLLDRMDQLAVKRDARYHRKQKTRKSRETAQPTDTRRHIPLFRREIQGSRTPEINRC